MRRSAWWVGIAVAAAAAGLAEWAHAGGPPLLPKVPEKYLRMRNPVADDRDAFASGERIYRAKCARCHEPGKSGGAQAPDLNVPEIKTAAPGALYWVIEKGNSDMPSFARFPAKYRWALVTYLQKRD